MLFPAWCRVGVLFLPSCGHALELSIIEKDKRVVSWYEGESISNQPYLFPVEIHLFFFDVIAL